MPSSIMAMMLNHNYLKIYFYFISMDGLKIKYIFFSVDIRTSSYFDSFMLQARVTSRNNGNASLVGSFEAIPSIAKFVNCFAMDRSSVADRGLPIRLSNMSFTWRAPPSDLGPIKFVASIVVGEIKQDKRIFSIKKCAFSYFL